MRDRRYTDDERAGYIVDSLKSLPKRLRTRIAREMAAFEKERTVKIKAGRSKKDLVEDEWYVHDQGEFVFHSPSGKMLKRKPGDPRFVITPLQNSLDYGVQGTGPLTRKEAEELKKIREKWSAKARVSSKDGPRKR